MYGLDRLYVQYVHSFPGPAARPYVQATENARDCVSYISGSRRAVALFCIKPGQVALKLHWNRIGVAWRMFPGPGGITDMESNPEGTDAV